MITYQFQQYEFFFEEYAFTECNGSGVQNLSVTMMEKKGVWLALDMLKQFIDFNICITRISLKCVEVFSWKNVCFQNQQINHNKMHSTEFPGWIKMHKNQISVINQY